VALKSNYSFDPLNFLAPLASLFIKLGGDMSEFLNHRSVWFVCKVGGVPAGPANPDGALIQPTKDYFLDMAALAGKVEKLLIEHAENHGSPLCVSPTPRNPSPSGLGLFEFGAPFNEACSAVLKLRLD
jgi:hypothetical protein